MPQHEGSWNVLVPKILRLAEFYRTELLDTHVEVYYQALRHLSEHEQDIAIDRVLKTYIFMPKPAEILKSLREAREDMPPPPAPEYEEAEPPGEEEKAAWEKLRQKLKSVSKEKEMPKADAAPYMPPLVEYFPIAEGKTLQEWCMSQDLGDDLPRTPFEIMNIKAVKGFGKKKPKADRQWRMGQP
jgi:hypothetical protein